ncbi:hypothetical protein OY671_013142, partial [Metschnikowia pulcherrima]
MSWEQGGWPARQDWAGLRAPGLVRYNHGMTHRDGDRHVIDHIDPVAGDRSNGSGRPAATGTGFAGGAPHRAIAEQAR